MKIIRAYPPNFAAITTAFPHVKGKPGVLYAYGDQLFNPSGVVLPAWLIAHEHIHSAQQGENPALWWQRYIEDPAFRLSQEIEAHREEFHTFKALTVSDRKGVVYLDALAARLSGPLYGELISWEEARHAIAG